MGNHGLGTQNDKMCADSLIPQIPHNLFDPSAQISQLFGMLLKKALITPLFMSFVIVFQCAKGKFPTLWWASATIFSAIKNASLFTRDEATTPISHN